MRCAIFRTIWTAGAVLASFIAGASAQDKLWIARCCPSRSQEKTHLSRA